jgi:hypothetical protein
MSFMGNICSFYEYYYDFLDVNKGKKVNNVLYIKTSNRNEVLNREFSYPLIISKFNDNIYMFLYLINIMNQCSSILKI